MPRGLKKLFGRAAGNDHRMWPVIGVYGGQEENAFYRRGEGRLMAHGNKTLKTKDTLPLCESVIHAVTNPLDQITAAIHVYGGDFFAVPRSEWDPQALEERAFDLEHAKQVFEESNQRLRAAKVGVTGSLSVVDGGSVVADKGQKKPARR